jgi:multiple sugar transport system permease protein
MTEQTRLSQATRRELTGWLYVAPALAIVLLLFVAPLGLMAWMSLHDWSLVGDPAFLGVDNYIGLLQDERFHAALAFSARFALVIVPLIMLVGLALGALIAGDRVGTGAFRSIYFLPLVVGFAAASYIWLWLFNGQIGLANKLLVDLGVIDASLPWLADPTLGVVSASTLMVWKIVGFSMLLFMGAIRAVPQDLRDAASVDGASRWQAFRFVTLPLMKNTVALVFVFATVACLLVFEPFFILTRGGPGSSTEGVVQWIFGTSFFAFRLGYGAAASIVLLLILVLLTSIQVRVFTRDQ